MKHFKLLLLILAGCSTHTYQPAPAAQATLDPRRVASTAFGYSSAVVPPNRTFNVVFQPSNGATGYELRWAYGGGITNYGNTEGSPFRIDAPSYRTPLMVQARATNATSKSRWTNEKLDVMISWTNTGPVTIYRYNGLWDKTWAEKQDFTRPGYIAYPVNTAPGFFRSPNAFLTIKVVDYL